MSPTAVSILEKSLLVALVSVATYLSTHAADLSPLLAPVIASAATVVATYLNNLAGNPVASKIKQMLPPKEAR